MSKLITVIAMIFLTGLMSQAVFAATLKTGESCNISKSSINYNKNGTVLCKYPDTSGRNCKNCPDGHYTKKQGKCMQGQVIIDAEIYWCK